MQGGPKPFRPSICSPAQGLVGQWPLAASRTLTRGARGRVAKGPGAGGAGRAAGVAAASQRPLAGAAAARPCGLRGLAANLGHPASRAFQRLACPVSARLVCTKTVAKNSFNYN